MPRSKTALTLPAIRNAKPGDVLRDDKLKGLHLRAFDQSKSFWLHYRTKAGKERRPKIGDWPTFSLDEARDIARAWLQKIGAGGDPVQDWADEAAAPTVDDLCDRYLKWAEARKKPHSFVDDKYYINKIVRPRLGKLKAAAVTHTDAEDIIVAYGKKHPVAANRLRACMSKMFNLAEKWQIRPLDTNPVKHIERNREKKRKRYTRPEEAIAVHQALQGLRARFPQGVAFIYLLIFTGARPIEIANARPSQRQGNRLELEEHKTDGTGETRIIFLPPQAVEILDALPASPDGTITGLKSPRHVWRLVIKQTGIQNLRLYDLRHSFASAGLLAGDSLEEIGQLLGHASPETTKRYAHLMEEVGVARATRAADALENMMTAKKEPA